MSATAAVGAQRPTIDVLTAYTRHVDGLGVGARHRRETIEGARTLVSRYHDLNVWMARPTPARIVELRRLHAFAFFGWCVLEGHVAVDLEMLVAVPSGVGLSKLWADRHPADVARVAATGRGLGWSDWVNHRVSVVVLSQVCILTGKRLDDLVDADLDALTVELAGLTSVSRSGRKVFNERILCLGRCLYELGMGARPRRQAGRVARTPAAFAETIQQPEIRSEVVRYAQTLGTVLTAVSVHARVKALIVLTDYLGQHHPHVCRLNELERSAHIEPFLAWARTRPWKGSNGKGRTVTIGLFHHDVMNLKVFFEDIAEWGWTSQPRTRLFYRSDLPRLPEPIPRALAPEADRALMAAAATLTDPFARAGIQLLRATGMRIGELLDLELDCVIDFEAHGRWLRVPLGKLNTERTVPLDDDTVAVLDDWIAQRRTQRAIPHPRHGKPADFVFVEHGRRLGRYRIGRGLHDAAQAAGLHRPDGTLLHVTPHQLRHSFGTSLVNGGISLPALMALLGHVTPQMTLRYAKLANPTIRAAYDDAMHKSAGRRSIFVIPAGQATAIPSRIDWLNAEMLKTRVAHGYCTLDPAAGPCPYANICEQCDNYQPAPEFAPIIAAQLTDIEALRADAANRGWDTEAARQAAVADHLQRHLRHIDVDDAG